MIPSVTARHRLMILEDEGLVAEDMRGILERMGHEVVHVSARGDETLERAAVLRPDLVVCDIHVRGSISGIATAVRLRNELDIPSIFATAYADSGVLQEAVAAAPYGYCVKPISERELRATVTVALHRRAAEERTRSMERWLSMTLGSIGDAVVALDVDGNVSFVNATAERLTGWVRTEAWGRPVDEILQVEKNAAPLDLRAIIEEVSASGVIFHLTGDVELRTRSGTRLAIDDSIAPIRRDDGTIEGAVIIFRDRTLVKEFENERRAHEKRLEQAQRLESLGVLAGGIAHDFNNLLTVILGNASLARAEGGREAEVLNEALANIEQAGMRGAALCAAMLAYAGKGPHARTHLDLGRFIEQTADLLRVSVPRHISFELVQEGVLPRIEVDAGQIQQVLMNLIINASESIAKPSGRITLRTACRDLDAQAIAALQLDTPLAPGQYVVAEVTDNGEGMSPEVLARILDPFFTTKITGRGLGMSAVRGILQQHRGAIAVTSVVGEGSSFRLFLPVGASPESSPGGATPRAGLPAMLKGLVVLIDDEPGVLASSRTILTRAGLEVLAFPSGDLALAALRERQRDVRLVVTDLTMPGMTGREVVREVHALLPALPVLIMSGWSGEEASDSIATEGPIGFLQKPFLRDQLLGAVAQLLGQR